MDPLFFSQKTNFHAIDSLISALQSQVDNQTDVDSILYKINVFVSEFLNKQTNSAIIPAEWHTFQRCYLAFEGFGRRLEEYSCNVPILKASHIALTHFKSIFQTEGSFQNFLSIKSQKLLSCTSSLMPLMVEESSDEQNLTMYCQQLISLYDPPSLNENKDYYATALLALENYIATQVDMGPDNHLAVFHWLCLKLCKYYQHTADLQAFYCEFEELFENCAQTFLAPYLKIKMAEIIFIHLKYNGEASEHFTNKYRKILLSLTIDSKITDRQLKLRANYLLATSFMNTECLPNFFMAKKNWEEVLKNCDLHSSYYCQAHYHLALMHLFGIGNKFEVCLATGLAHLEKVLEMPFLTKDMSVKVERVKAICASLHSSQTYSKEIPLEALFDWENFCDSLYTYLSPRFFKVACQLDPISEVSVIFSIKSYLVKLHQLEVDNPCPHAYLDFQATHLGLQTYFNQLQQSKAIRWHQYWHECISKFVACFIKEGINLCKKLDSNASADSLFLDLLDECGAGSIAAQIVSIVNSCESFYHDTSKGTKTKVPAVNLLNDCLYELQKVAQGNSKHALEVSVQANYLLDYMRLYLSEYMETQSVPAYQTAYMQLLNNAKISLLNARRFSLCPLKEIDVICRDYSTVNFLHAYFNKQYFNCMLSLLGQKYNLEKSAGKDNYETFINALYVYTIEMKKNNPEDKLDILKEFQKHLKFMDMKELCLAVIKHFKDSYKEGHDPECQYRKLILNFLAQFVELLKFQGVENIDELYALIKKNLQGFLLYESVMDHGFNIGVIVEVNEVKPQILKNQPKAQQALLQNLLPYKPPFLLYDLAIYQSKRKGASFNEHTLHFHKVEKEAKVLESSFVSEDSQPALAHFPTQTSTLESKKLARDIEQRREKKQLLKGQRMPAHSAVINPENKMSPCSIPMRPSVCLSSKAMATYEKIFTPQNPSMDVHLCQNFDANDFRIDGMEGKIKREEVAHLIEELGGKYIKAQGKGSHTKCTLASLEESSDKIILNGQSMAFANFEPFDSLAHQQGTQRAEASQMILTKSAYLKPYQVRQLCRKLIALGFTPHTVKRK